MMLYKSVSPDQLSQLVRQHSAQCLARYIGDQLSAPSDDHQMSNLAHARLFALIAENPAQWADGTTAQMLDTKPLTAPDRQMVEKLIETYRSTGGPINPNYVRTALTEAGIEPTLTNMRKCLPAIAIAKSQACLTANKETYAAGDSVGWELPPPMVKLMADASAPPAINIETSAARPPATVPQQPTSGPFESDDRYIDAPLSEVLKAVQEHQFRKKAWSEDVVGDAGRAWAFVIAAAGDIPFSKLRQHHIAAVDALFPVMDPQYRYLAAFHKGGIRGVADQGIALLAEKKGDHLGLAPGTVNKHLTWIGHVIKIAAELGYRPAEVSCTGARRKGKLLNTSKANDKRPRWRDDEFIKFMSGPIYEGCAGLFDRFTPGPHVFHDGIYFGAPVIVNLAGRSSEGNGLEIVDVVLDAPIPHFVIRENDVRGLKTKASERRLPILPKLKTLHFDDLVRHNAGLGISAVFPEFVHPTMSPAKCFYKAMLEKQMPLVFPQGTSSKRGKKDVDMVSVRKLAADVLVRNNVHPELRAYILGHEQEVTTHKIYEDDPPLEILLDAMMCLESLMDHLEPRPFNPRPIEWLRYGAPRGRPKKSEPGCAH
jgi:hypothetical protein